MYIKKKTLSSILCSMLYAEALCFVDYALSDKTHLVSKTLVMQMPPCHVDATSSLRHHLVLYGRNFYKAATLSIRSQFVVDRRKCIMQTILCHVHRASLCRHHIFMKSPYCHREVYVVYWRHYVMLTLLYHLDATLSY